MKGILGEILRKIFYPVINMDSQSALYLCKDPMYHERTKHIDVRFHFIRDKVEEQVLMVRKIKGEENPADFGTKIVPANKFCFCRNALKIFDIH